MKRVWSLTQYIEKILIKLEGFESVEEYYRRSTCNHVLDKVKIPLFFLSALDDPIIGSKQIPLSQTNENILIGVTSAGGHLSHFEGLVFPHKQWFPEPSFEFLSHFIKGGELYDRSIDFSPDFQFN